MAKYLILENKELKAKKKQGPYTYFREFRQGIPVLLLNYYYL